MTIAAILAIIAGALVLCVPQAALALAILAGIFGALAVVAGIVSILAHCKRPCGSGLLFAWQVVIGVGFSLLYFTPCCPSFIVIGVASLAAGAGLMALWIRNCNPGFCNVVAELSLCIVSVVIPLLTWLGAIGPLKICINPVLDALLSVIPAILAVILAHCVLQNQNPAGNTRNMG
jgi:hypothetical protein